MILTLIFSHIVVTFLFFRYVILVQIDADNMIFFTVTFPIFQTCSMSTFLVVIKLLKRVTSISKRVARFPVICNLHRSHFVLS